MGLDDYIKTFVCEGQEGFDNATRAQFYTELGKRV